MLKFDKNGDFFIEEDDIVETVEESVIEKSPTLDLFRDILKNILESSTRLDWSLAKKTYSPFVINRCLANNNTFLPIVYKLNRFASNISPEMHYRLLHKYIKPKKKRFLGYFKQKNMDSDSHKIAKFFNINDNEMASYLSIIGEKKTKELLKNINNLDKQPKKKTLKK